MNFYEASTWGDHLRFELERASEKAARAWRFRNVGRKNVDRVGAAVAAWRAAVKAVRAAARPAVNKVRHGAHNARA